MLTVAIDTKTDSDIYLNDGFNASECGSTVDLTKESHSTVDLTKESQCTVDITKEYRSTDGTARSETDMKEVHKSKCTKFKWMCRHILASHHPLPENPHAVRNLAQGFLCPPSGKVGAILLVAVLFALWWATLLAITKKEAMPGGSLFPMLVMFASAWCAGYLVKHTPLPPLVGMLIVGAILGNVHGVNVARHISSSWSSTARSIALTVILTRAGLGLDPAALKKLSFVVLRLAFAPSILECIVDGLLARYLLDFPWTWAFMLGFVMAVVSPAVVVPSMLSLSDRGYGLDKGIPTLIIAACSLDSVLAVTGFGVLLGVSFTQGGLAWGIVKGPLEAVVGVCYGVLSGMILWYLPQKNSKNLVLFRSSMLVGAGLLAIFGSKLIDWSGSGPLGCLTVAFVAAQGWRKEYQATKSKNPVEDVMAVLWMLFMPLLFGLIGSAVDLSSLEPLSVGTSIGILFAGLLIRILAASLTTVKTDLNKKEKFFVSLAWIPKATVQAAIGAVAYDTAVEKGATDLIPLGKKILNQAVLAIVIAAPIGSALIALLGPRLLHKTEKPCLDNLNQTTADVGHINQHFVDDELTSTKL